MPRPKNKQELEVAARANFRALISFIQDCPHLTLYTFPEGTLNRNIADVLAHLHHWHNMMLTWYDQGMEGGKPKMPAEGYTWKTLPSLNQNIHEKYKDLKFEDAFERFSLSHNKVMHLIAAHSNEELFTKKKYHWTGSTSLGTYLISSTSSHYEWALKLIKKSVAVH